MPRAFYNKQDKQVFYIYDMIIGRTKSMGLNQAKIADMLNISPQLYGYKLKHKNLTLWEILKLFEILQFGQDDISRLMIG